MRQLATFTLSAIFTIASFAPFIAMNDADARGYKRSSSSFSRSVVRSKPKTSFKAGKKKTNKIGKQGAFWNKGTGGKSIKAKGGKKSTSLTKKSGNTVKTKQAIKLVRQEAKFKKRASVPGLKKKAGGSPPSRIARTRAYEKSYKNHEVFGKARNANPATYYNRRNTYYDNIGWSEPPRYVYNSQPSWGPWDTIFLYSMLNNSSTGGQFAHNHQNDPDYLKWRAEQDNLAKDNAELRAQLAAVDAAKAQYEGTPVYDGYLPPNVDPDVALASGARAAALPKLRICTGATDGAYFLLTTGVMAPSAEYANIVPVVTAGTGQTLKYIQDGKCDAGWAQANGYWNFIEDYETTNLPFVRLFSPYKEAVHMVCHEDGPSKLSDMDEDHKILFMQGSGAEVTYRDWIGENSDYEDIPNSLSNPDKLTVASNTAALLAVSKDPSHNTCMLYVAAQGATDLMKDINTTSLTMKTVLIDINDGDLLDTLDPSDNPVYEKTQIDSSVYENLTRQSGSFYGSGDVHTVHMNADLLLSEAWKAKHPAVADKIMIKFITMEERIKDVLRPK